MPKTKKVILIGDQTYPLEGVKVTLTLAQLAQLLVEEKKSTLTECIQPIRPFITNPIGRERLQAIELGCEEELIVLQEHVSESPDYVFIDDERSQVIEGVDYGQVIQTIRRNK